MKIADSFGRICYFFHRLHFLLFFIFFISISNHMILTYRTVYASGLAPYLESISEADAKVMIQTIETFYQVMCERREKFEK